MTEPPVVKERDFAEERDDSKRDRRSAKKKSNLRRALRRTGRWVRGRINGANITVGATVVIAVFAILQWGVFKDQVAIMADSGKQTDKIIAADERLASANERAAKAMADDVANAKSALAQSQKALDRTIAMHQDDRRAWVGTERFDADFKPGEPAKLSVTFGNYGSTPALKVHGWCRWEAVPVNTPFKWRESQPKSHSVYTLQPKQDASLDPLEDSPTPTQDVVNDIASGKRFVYVFGRITYHDVFGREHHTEFATRGAISHGKGSWLVLSEHNTPD